MAIEPTGLIGPAINLARPALSQASSIWRRRGASPLDHIDPGSVDRELDEALMVLCGDAGTLPQWLVRQLTALLSDRPQIFSEPEVRDWLRLEEVRTALKRSAIDVIANRDIDLNRTFASDCYARQANDGAWYGVVAFDFALSYLLRTLDSKIPVETRLAIDVANRNTAHLETLLAEVLQRFDGLPIEVARSIVADFGEDGDQRGAGELEVILRRKAVEYHALREELALFRTDDPRVLELRDQALTAVERGDFDDAQVHLIHARKRDREASREAERVRMERRSSEAETVLSIARLSALRANYREAYTLSMEARELAKDSPGDVSSRALLLAANYLNTECHAIGSEGVIEANIREAEQGLLPFATAIDEETRLAVLLEIADLYALLGYREGNNRRLAQAAALFRRISRDLPQSAPSELRLRSRKSLGDTHVEIGLNRNSIRQARVGLRIMQAALDDETILVSPAERANALIRLGTAQANTGLIVEGGTEFDDSVRTYEAAMAMVEGLDEPLTRARAWWGLAIALAGQGKAQRSVSILARSEQCCDEALKVLTRDEYPVDWATNVANRANAKLERGILENGVDTLLGAVRDYELALEVRTPKRFPLGFIKSSGNMAIAKRYIADRTDDPRLAEQAKRDVEAALECTGEGVGEHWPNYYRRVLSEIEEVISRLSRNTNTTRP